MKIKSLAEEVRILRFEKKRIDKNCVWYLNLHKNTVIRPESRYSLLAYAYLRGMPYKAVEASCKESPKVSRIAKLAARFDGYESLDARIDKVSKWLNEKA